MTLQSESSRIIRDLYTTLAYLDESINKAEDVILENTRISEETRAELKSRITQYRALVQSQRESVAVMIQHMLSGDTEGIRESVNRINSVSEFMKTDAEEVVSFLGGFTIDVRKEDA
mgnify:CR=1 FL=1